MSTGLVVDLIWHVTFADLSASELAAVLGSGTLGGTCGTLSFVAGPGHIRSVGGQNFIKFGELDNRLTEQARTPTGLFCECESFG